MCLTNANIYNIYMYIHHLKQNKFKVKIYMTEWESNPGPLTSRSGSVWCSG